MFPGLAGQPDQKLDVGYEAFRHRLPELMIFYRDKFALCATQRSRGSLIVSMMPFMPASSCMRTVDSLCIRLRIGQSVPMHAREAEGWVVSR